MYPSDDLNYHKGAIFTVELGSLVENGFDLGLEDYPIFNEGYREGLNTKIVEHYWFREIGTETPELFRRFLNRRMNEVMPYYNQLYQSALDFQKKDPYLNNDITSTGQSNTKGTASGTSSTHAENDTVSDSESDSTSDSRGRTLVNTTPQMQLSGREDYASNITDTQSETTSHSTSTQTGTATSDSNATNRSDTDSTEDFITKTTGLTGTTAVSVLENLRRTFLNIDMMVIDELADLFFGLYTDYWNAL